MHDLQLETLSKGWYSNALTVSGPVNKLPMSVHQCHRWSIAACFYTRDDSHGCSADLPLLAHYQSCNNFLIALLACTLLSCTLMSSTLLSCTLLACTLLIMYINVMYIIVMYINVMYGVMYCHAQHFNDCVSDQAGGLHTQQRPCGMHYTHMTHHHSLQKLAQQLLLLE